MIDTIILFFASLLANTMSAFAGGGSGLVQFPVLILMGLPFSQALATHKMATFMLGLGSMTRNLKGSVIDWPLAIYILVVGAVGTILGAYVITQIPDDVAQITLGVLTIGLGIYSF